MDRLHITASLPALSHSRLRVTLNVGGQHFTTYATTLARHDASRLGNLSKTDPSYDQQQGEYFFDRNPRLFPYILDFYRTGEIHFPHDLCGPTVKRELDFWGIPDRVIGPCCWKTYSEFDDERRTLEDLEKALSAKGGGGGAASYPGVDPMSGRPRQALGWSKWKHDVWIFLEDPSSSIAAKVWAYFYMCLLLLSITIVCLVTDETFRVPTRAGVGTNTTTAGTTTTTTLPVTTAGAPLLRMDARFAEGFILTAPSENGTLSLGKKLKMFLETDPHPALEVLDIFCTFVFVAELLLRFAVWPDKKRLFLFNFFNVIDTLAVSLMFIMTVGNLIRPYFWFEKDLFSAYLLASMACVFRAIRIMKLVKHSRGLQLMYLAIRASIREILLLFLLIAIATLVFSTTIYYVEFGIDDGDFGNIPTGFWWSIVTMTTVGYGDKVPQSGLGYVVGSMCALCGMLITGLPIPVIANSFYLYYNYAKLRDKLAGRDLGYTSSSGGGGMYSGGGGGVVGGGVGAGGKGPGGLHAHEGRHLGDRSDSYWSLDQYRLTNGPPGSRRGSKDYEVR